MGEKRAAGFLIFRELNKTIEYLLLKASYGDHHWSPPKGHVDPGEDDFTTALRETSEEAGYKTSDLKIHKDLSKTLTYDVKGRQKIVVYWLAELLNPNQSPILSNEHEDMRWLSKEPAIALAGFKDFAEMVEHFDVIVKDLKK